MLQLQIEILRAKHVLVPADLVERVEFKKGIQYAENGDYTAAGSASFVLYDKLPENYVNLRVDAEGEYRVTAAGSVAIGDGTLLAAVAQEGGDGALLIE